MTVSGARYTSTRPRGFPLFVFESESLALVEDVNEVLDEFRAYLPMTARQIFYRLVGSREYEKTERAYERLLETLNRARRAGLIRFAAIRDDGFSGSGGGGYESASEWVEFTKRDAERYRRDRQLGQRFSTEIWVEAEGMVPMVARMIRDYSIPVYSSGGFNSVTAKHDTARRFASLDRPTRVLHVGDFDPSGLAIIDSLAEDVLAFAWGLGISYELEPTFERLAVTPEQIEELSLPGAPAKRTDRRGDFSELAVQAEAIAPPDLEGIVLDRVTSPGFFDADEFEDQIRLEEEERDELISLLEGFGE